MLRSFQFSDMRVLRSPAWIIVSKDSVSFFLFLFSTDLRNQKCKEAFFVSRQVALTSVANATYPCIIVYGVLFHVHLRNDTVAHFQMNERKSNTQTKDDKHVWLFVCFYFQFIIFIYLSRFRSETLCTMCVVFSCFIL